MAEAVELKAKPVTSNFRRIELAQQQDLDRHHLVHDGGYLGAVTSEWSPEGGNVCLVLSVENARIKKRFLLDDQGRVVSVQLSRYLGEGGSQLVVQNIKLSRLEFPEKPLFVISARSTWEGFSKWQQEFQWITKPRPHKPYKKYISRYKSEAQSQIGNEGASG